ncbi:hypothetical protein [Herbaspirillum sp. meg3]|uniref:hypothetical protein n=1 Tax=Herbaspirillum sp. meg3 TaxID=2025949 RepID=UPI0012FD58BC|nr:hypothetical protein [Herbaspirillum sp. meg3]
MSRTFYFYCCLCAVSGVVLLPVLITVSIVFAKSIYSMAGLARSRFSLADSASNLLIDLCNRAKHVISKTVLRRQNVENKA